VDYCEDSTCGRYASTMMRLIKLRWILFIFYILIHQHKSELIGKVFNWSEFGVKRFASPFICV